MVCGPSAARPVPEAGSGGGRRGWVLALGFFGQLVEETWGPAALWLSMAASASATVSSDSVVSTTARSARMGAPTTKASASASLGRASTSVVPLGAVDHDDRVVGAFGQAVDADLAHAAAKGLD